MIKNITSVKNPLIMQTAALKTEGTEKEFLLEGDKFINDTDPRDIIRIFSTDKDLCDQYESKGCEVYEVSENVLAKLSPSSSITSTKNV